MEELNMMIINENILVGYASILTTVIIKYFLKSCTWIYLKEI